MRALWRRVREVVDRRRVDRELASELAQHLEMRVDHHRRSGLSDAEARRRALADLGSPSSAVEAVHDGRTGATVELWFRDARRALIGLGRAPVSTALSIGGLAVGLAASTLLFTLINGAVLAPLPYPEPGRLVRVFDTHLESAVARTGVASGNLADWRRDSTVLTGVAGYYAMGRTVSGDAGSASEVLLATQVTTDFFDVLAVGALHGRTFSGDEYARATFNSAAMPVGQDPVVIISHRLWRQRFGADPAAVGRTITVERRPFRIVGVMPASFALPNPRVDLWLPWHVPPTAPRDQHYLDAIARLKDDVTISNAEADLNGVAARLGDAYPATNRGWGVTLSPLRTEVIGSTSGLLWTMLGAVAVAVLVASMTVAILALARGLDRRAEVAVRVALGASRSRIVRECSLESAVVAVAAAVIGVALAAAGLRIIPAWLPDLNVVADLTIDLRVVGFISLATVLAGLVAALPQAWHAAGAADAAGLTAGRVVSSTGRRHRLRDGLVVAQVAAAVVLLTGSGLMVRSLQQLREVDPGFDAANVLVAPVFLDSTRYDSGAKVRAYYDDLFTRLSVLPSVTAVGSATTVPTSPLGPDFDRPVWADSALESDARHSASVRIVTPGYFDVLRPRLISGRPIDAGDRPESPIVVVVNDALARRVWPGQPAVGQRLAVDYSNGVYAYEVVGVIDDMRASGPRSEPKPEIFLAHSQRSYLIQNVMVRTAGDPAAVAEQVLATMRSIDADKPPHALTPMVDLVGATYVRERRVATVLTAFGLAATLLAVCCLGAVLSHRVREREREIGVRLALGASAVDVVRWVTASGIRLVGAGLGVGVLVSFGAAAVLRTMLFGVSAADPATLIGVAVVLALTAGIAIAAPAWRAVNVDPVTTLRRS
jgi:putative ABC transport system permease protein